MLGIPAVVAQNSLLMVLSVFKDLQFLVLIIHLYSE